MLPIHIPVYNLSSVMPEEVTVYGLDDSGDIEWCNHGAAADQPVMSGVADNITITDELCCDQCGRIYNEDSGEWE